MFCTLPTLKAWHVGRQGMLAGFVILALGYSPAQATDEREHREIPGKTSSKFLAAFRKAVSGPSTSTVRVQCKGKDVALGTVVGADGWIVTKASELQGVAVCRLADGRKLDAAVIGVHEPFDLALLKVDAKGLAPVDWVESNQARAGDWLASAGTGRDPVAAGVASVVTRTLSPRESGPRNPTAGGFLGITLQQDDSAPKVATVLPGSAAAKAGLKVDDQILAVGDKATEKPETLLRLLGKAKPGEQVSLKIQRDDEELVLEATLDKRPPAIFGDTTATMGARINDRRGGFTTILQHDSILRPEDCGGPLVDLDGKVVGINIARVGRIETDALPAELVLGVLVELVNAKSTVKEVVQKTPAKPLSFSEKLALAKAALQQAGMEKKVAVVEKPADKADAEKGTRSGPEQ